MEEEEGDEEKKDGDDEVDESRIVESRSWSFELRRSVTIKRWIGEEEEEEDEDVEEAEEQEEEQASEDRGVCGASVGSETEEETRGDSETQDPHAPDEQDE